MKKVKALLLSALAVAAVGVVAPKTSVTASAATRDFACTYSARGKDTEYMTYGSTQIVTYTAEEAAAAGVPAGYENEVFEIINDAPKANSCGVFLDFSQENVSISMLDSLQFRVYITPHSENTGSRPQVRITDPTGVNDKWIYQPQSTPTPAGEWTTVTVPYAENFVNISQNGKLDKFEFAVRMNALAPVYVDSIQYVLKENDGVAPVITYEGEDTLFVGLGSALDVDVSAFDAQENCAVDVEYVWGEGVTLNANGTPNEVGTYTLTLQAKDSHGNVSTKEITVNVIETDDVAPVIDLAFDTVKTTVGTKPMLEVTASDNYDRVTLTKVWSDGALDARGRLTEGTHTWTLTAKDAFGNTTEKVVTFIVTATEPQYSFVTNEENLATKHTVTFDGENAVEVLHGFAVDRPADPVREATDGKTYTFIGWYYGEAEWDFSQGVTEDMNIESRWDVKKRLYRVTFDGAYTGVTVAHGDMIETDDVPANPEKAMDERYMYEFAGWYNGETEWNFATDVVTANVDLVARFNKIDRLYTVTFDGENEQTVKYGELVSEPAVPEKAGYVFEGWYSGITQWKFNVHTVRTDVNLVSKWSKVSDEPTDSVDSGDADSDSQSNDDTSKPGSGSILDGCKSTVGISAGLTALCAAVVVLWKKKEN